MIRLKDMAEALSFKPTLLIWWNRNLVTSYKGNPLKPGMISSLLFLERKDTGADRIIALSSLFKAWVRFVVYWPYKYPALSGILWHTGYAP